MNDLFTNDPIHQPLAERMRPRRLEEVSGQEHLIGPGKPLTVAIESGKPHSMILWGPPGVGKTTLARLIANAFTADFIALSAVFAGVKDIRDAIAKAELARDQFKRHTILFVDEVHRFNKAQQDAFLPYVEQGLVSFIGATTENPSFEVNSALLSRAQVYVLEPLSGEALREIFERARALELTGIDIKEEALQWLINYADGDARRLLNATEQIAAAMRQRGVSILNKAVIEQTLSEQAARFDNQGEQFYDQISALHKSVRGSAPDAALYWLARMLAGGADPLYLGRRLVRMANEDIGLADPRAVRIALDACEVYERLGSPEGELALAQAVVYLAVAPKSNAVYNAYNQARSDAARLGTRPVPLHLRNAPTQLMKNLAYGRDYRYAHDEPGAYAAGENYFPEGMEDTRYYMPTSYGLEAKIAERLDDLRERDKNSKN